MVSHVFHEIPGIDARANTRPVPISPLVGRTLCMFHGSRGTVCYHVARWALQGYGFCSRHRRRAYDRYSAHLPYRLTPAALQTATRPRRTAPRDSHSGRFLPADRTPPPPPPPDNYDPNNPPYRLPTPTAPVPATRRIRRRIVFETEDLTDASTPPDSPRQREDSSDGDAQVTEAVDAIIDLTASDESFLDDAEDLDDVDPIYAYFDAQGFQQVVLMFSAHVRSREELPTVQEDAPFLGDECVICFDPFEVGQEYVQFECAHRLHSHCLAEMCITKAVRRRDGDHVYRDYGYHEHTCPMCRASIKDTLLNHRHSLFHNRVWPSGCPGLWLFVLIHRLRETTDYAIQLEDSSTRRRQPVRMDVLRTAAGIVGHASDYWDEDHASRSPDPSATEEAVSAETPPLPTVVIAATPPPPPPPPPAGTPEMREYRPVFRSGWSTAVQRTAPHTPPAPYVPRHGITTTVERVVGADAARPTHGEDYALLTFSLDDVVMGTQRSHLFHMHQAGVDDPRIVPVSLTATRHTLVSGEFSSHVTLAFPIDALARLADIVRSGYGRP